MAYDEYIVTSRTDRSQTSGRRFGFRVAENFFRRWPLYVLPLLLLTAVGVLQGRKSIVEYKSIGVLNVVNNPLLGDLSAIQGSDIKSYETPAGGTARVINELLRTDSFIQDIAGRAGLKDALDAGVITPLDIRRKVYAAADGDRLLQVVAVWPSSEAAFQLASAAIKGYTEYVLNAKVGNSTDAANFWAERAKRYQQKVEDADVALKDYLLNNPPPSNGSDRPVEQTLALQRLSGEITQAQAQVSNAQNEQQKAELTAQQLKSAAGQGLQIVDPPKQPTAPEPILRKQALTLAIYVVLGAILAITMLLISTSLDRTIRSTEDISSATGLTVVATVPNVAALRKRRRSAKGRSGRRERAPATT